MLFWELFKVYMHSHRLCFVRVFRTCFFASYLSDGAFQKDQRWSRPLLVWWFMYTQCKITLRGSLYCSEKAFLISCCCVLAIKRQKVFMLCNIEKDMEVSWLCSFFLNIKFKRRGDALAFHIRLKSVATSTLSGNWCSKSRVPSTVLHESILHEITFILGVLLWSDLLTILKERISILYWYLSSSLALPDKLWRMPWGMLHPCGR